MCRPLMIGHDRSLLQQLSSSAGASGFNITCPVDLHDADDGKARPGGCNKKQKVKKPLMHFM